MRRAAIVIGFLVLALALGQSPAAGAPATVSGEGAAGKNCVDEDGPAGEEAGDDGAGGTPKFNKAIYARTFTLDAALDGVEGGALPISIDEVCDLPKSLAKDAGKLAGGDGIALLLPRTEVLRGKTRLSGKRATAALGDADSAILTVRLVRPGAWRKGEEGGRVATFRARRIKVTD
jgi:hypothetical protein